MRGPSSTRSGAGVASRPTDEKELSESQPDREEEEEEGGAAAWMSHLPTSLPPASLSLSSSLPTASLPSSLPPALHPASRVLPSSLSLPPWLHPSSLHFCIPSSPLPLSTPFFPTCLDYSVSLPIPHFPSQPPFHQSTFLILSLTILPHSYRRLFPSTEISSLRCLIPASCSAKLPSLYLPFLHAPLLFLLLTFFPPPST